MSYLFPFSQKLRQWRLNAQLSQLQLGELIGIDQAVVSKVESGKRWLNVPQYSAMFSALDLSEDQRAEAWALLDKAAVEEGAEPGSAEQVAA